MRLIRLQTRRQIAVSSPVAVPIATVFAFLVEPANHVLLTGRRLHLLELAGCGEVLSGSMLLRGPLLIRRRVKTRVTSISEPRLIAGVGEVGGRTRAVVRWTLAERTPDCTEVCLDAEICSLARTDRLLLRLGARRWIARLFSETLQQLAAQLDGGAARLRVRAMPNAVDGPAWPAPRAALDVQVAPSRAS